MYAYRSHTHLRYNTVGVNYAWDFVPGYKCSIAVCFFGTRIHVHV